MCFHVLNFALLSFRGGLYSYCRVKMNADNIFATLEPRRAGTVLVALLADKYQSATLFFDAFPRLVLPLFRTRSLRGVLPSFLRADADQR